MEMRSAGRQIELVEQVGIRVERCGLARVRIGVIRVAVDGIKTKEIVAVASEVARAPSALDDRVSQAEQRIDTATTLRVNEHLKVLKTMIRTNCQYCLSQLIRRDTGLGRYVTVDVVHRISPLRRESVTDRDVGV